MTQSTPVVTVLTRGANTDDALPPGLDRLRTDAVVRIATADDLEQHLVGTDVLYLWDFFSDALERAFPAADRLRWVHVAAAGVDKLLFPALVESGVQVTNADGVFDRPMAEYVLACVLRHAKQLDVTQRDQSDRRWHTRVTRGVDGSHAVVVGVGGIGRETGRLLRAVGMRVTGVGRSARPGDEVFDRVASSAELARVVAEADYLVVALPLTAATETLIDAEVIAALPPRAYVVNVGRGRVVDEAALTDALVSGSIAGAALDTFVHEPLPVTSRLWSLPNVLVSPHTSSRTDGWLTRLDDQFLALFQAWSRGEALRPLVDLRLGYVRR